MRVHGGGQQHRSPSAQGYPERAFTVFAAMLSTSYNEGQDANVPIVLKAVSVDVARVGLGYMYGIGLGKDVNVPFAVDLWEFGHRFRLQSLEAEAKAVALRQMTTDDCDLVLYTAQMTSEEEVLSAVYKLVACNLRSVTRQECYGNLDYRAVNNILLFAKSDVMCRSHEFGPRILDIIDAIAAWARNDPIKRKKEWTKLLGHVDLTVAGISVQEIRDRVVNASPLNTSPVLATLWLNVAHSNASSARGLRECFLRVRGTLAPSFAQTMRDSNLSYVHTKQTSNLSFLRRSQLLS